MDEKKKRPEFLRSDIFPIEDQKELPQFYANRVPVERPRRTLTLMDMPNGL